MEVKSVRHPVVDIPEPVSRPMWYALPRNQDMINTITAHTPRGLYNERMGTLCCESDYVACFEPAAPPI
ncbi:MAG: hypothetical protein V2B19_03020 [Pseudomonadota bacterium]